MKVWLCPISHTIHVSVNPTTFSVHCWYVYCSTHNRRGQIPYALKGQLSLPSPRPTVPTTLLLSPSLLQLVTAFPRPHLQFFIQSNYSILLCQLAPSSPPHSPHWFPVLTLSPFLSPCPPVSLSPHSLSHLLLSLLPGPAFVLFAFESDASSSMPPGHQHGGSLRAHEIQALCSPFWCLALPQSGAAITGKNLAPPL